MTPWVYDGDLTAAHAVWVGQLTIKKFKSPPLPHVVPGGGVGVHIDKCTMTAASGESLLLSLECLQTTFSTAIERQVTASTANSEVLNIDRTPSYSIHCQLRGTQRFFPVLPFL